MKASEVYLKAAKECARYSGLPSCNAICMAAGWIPNKTLDYSRLHDRYADPYRRMLAPPGYEDSAFFLDAHVAPEEQHGWRTLALLFMHHIARDEERRKA